MEPESDTGAGAFVANDEVDAVRWCSPRSRQRLSTPTTGSSAKAPVPS
jgi:hypothetical protein